MWLVPEPGTRQGDAGKQFAQGVRQYDAGSFASALAAFDDPALAPTPIAMYARYYAALTCRQLQRPDAARTRLDAVRAATSDSLLAERATLAAADLAEASGEHARAAQLYDEAVRLRPAEPDLALAGLVRTALAAGDRPRAEAAALRLYYEFPTSQRTGAVVDLVNALRLQADAPRAAEFFRRDLGRGERLFAARLWDDARATFEGLRAGATGDDLELIDVRIAESDYHAARHRAAAERLAPYLETASRRAEAWYFFALAQRGLGHGDRFVEQAWALADAFPDSSWAADVLNHLASYFIVADRDADALEAFKRLLNGHPASRHAERAAWKLGWARYRDGGFAESADIFERGAVNAPRSDYRPAYLYWAGRARERAGDAATAVARYQVALADYRNSYYGRLAAKALADLGGSSATPPRAAAPASAPPAPPVAAVPAPVPALTTNASPPPNAPLIRALAGLELFGLAESEVQFAQRRWGTSRPLDATLAWLYSRQGDLRKGIGLMRRTYPQFLTAAADLLPIELRQVIFPLDYWPTIRRYAEARDLDPYLMAALVAQESTFQADARSSANAYGLMQIIPSTGRRLARAEGIRRFRTSHLVNPETNVRLGTRYFAGLLDDLGAEHYALASYNAGESRVVRWRADRPGWSREEFIDDIPFPETQNYVKRILGTAEDYRHLYGERGAVPMAVARKATAPPAASISDSRPAKHSAQAKSKTTSASKKASRKKTTTTSKSAKPRPSKSGRTTSPRGS
jgi:soluble lytic murein transglycosylase